nr:uncharacterized protein LOC117855764 [Setaria viridis]
MPCFSRFCMLLRRSAPTSTAAAQRHRAIAGKSRLLHVKAPRAAARRLRAARVAQCPIFGCTNAQGADTRSRQNPDRVTAEVNLANGTYELHPAPEEEAVADLHHTGVEPVPEQAEDQFANYPCKGWTVEWDPSSDGEDWDH